MAMESRLLALATTNYGLAAPTLHPDRVASGGQHATTAVALAERLGVRAPVMGAVAAVLGGGGTVGEAMGALMARPLRSEED